MSFVLPVDESPVTILGIVASLEIEAANEFAAFLDNQFLAAGEPEWFENIRFYRKSVGAPSTYFAKNDLRFVLGEATLDDSQIWHLIPRINQQWVNAADLLRKKLNQFHHQQLKPDLQTLSQVASLYQQVTEGPGLEVSGWARALKTRTTEILSGQFAMPDAHAPQPSFPDEVKDVEREYEEVIKEIEKRPPWGAKWSGPKPPRKLSVDKNTRDIYENGTSVKSELGELGDQVTETWLRYYPRGGEVWVDEDGATMGYIKGTATMIGWFGAAPDDDSDSVRGFVLPKEYEFTGSDILDIESRSVLSKNAEESFEEKLELLSKTVPEGTKLNITDYGDLFVPTDEGEPKRVTRMHKGIWFPGQLPG